MRGKSREQLFMKGKGRKNVAEEERMKIIRREK